MFQTVPLPINRSFSLYTLHWCMSYRLHLQLASRIRTEPVPSWSCSQAVSKPVWHIPLLCVQWKTPDDGQRSCPKHVEFYSKNKLEKLVHLVGFITRIYHDAWSPERQCCLLSFTDPTTGLRAFLTLILNCFLCYTHLCPALLPVNLNTNCQIITPLSLFCVHVHTALHSTCGSIGVCQKYVTAQTDTFHMDQTILFSDTGDMTHTSSCVSATCEWWTALSLCLHRNSLYSHNVGLKNGFSAYSVQSQKMFPVHRSQRAARSTIVSRLFLQGWQIYLYTNLQFLFTLSKTRCNKLERD